MKKFFIIFVVLYLATGLLLPRVLNLYAAEHEDMFDIQFAGDTYLSSHALRLTKTTVNNPRAFSHLSNILGSSRHNLVNLEGVITEGFFPFVFGKRFLLKMPLHVAALLKKVNIDFVSLANNHILDYGEAGLFDTLAQLDDAGIRYLGAGFNLKAAVQPLSLMLKQGRLCLLAYSRTLPVAFYARDQRGGTAYESFTAIGRRIRECKKHHRFVIVSFHWGQEKMFKPKKYQRRLAHLAIQSGADAIIGHHPHVLQSIEVYQGKPIFYSLGNFVFSSYTPKSTQQGLMVAVRWPLSVNEKAVWRLVPIHVQNNEVYYRPRPYRWSEKSSLASQQAFLSRYCQPYKKASTQQWQCRI